LDYCQARYYSPELMRFVNRDTYDVSNRYAYCDGNPVMNIDPSGHDAQEVLGITFLSILAVAVIGGVIYGGLRLLYDYINKLRAEIKSQRASISGLSAEVRTLQDRIAILQAGETALTTERDNLLSQKADLEQRVATSRSTENELRQQIERLQAVRRSRISCSVDFSAVRSQLDGLSASTELEGARKTIAELSARNATLVRQMEEGGGKEIAVLQQRLQEQSQQTVQYMGQYEQTNKELLDLKARHHDVQESLKRVHELGGVEENIGVVVGSLPNTPITQHMGKTGG